MNLRDLVLDHLKEAGFEVDQWDESIVYDKRTRWSFRGGNPPEPKPKCYRYNIIPGLAFLQIPEGNNNLGIKLNGPIVDFDKVFDVNDPQSFIDLEETLIDLYIWMQKIKPDWSLHDWQDKKDTIHESAGSSSQPNSRDRG